jgi:subtilisin-like proprotein convertase family protein
MFLRLVTARISRDDETSIALRAEEKGMFENRWLRLGRKVVPAALAVGLVMSGFITGGEGSVSARKRVNAEFVQNFSVSGPIAIPDGNQTLGSTIFVSGFQTEVADVNITIANLNHARPSDLDFVLVGPGGQTAVFVSDVGSSANNVTLTLDDSARGQVSSSGPMTSGTFQPTNFSTLDNWFPPLGTVGSGSHLSVFNSTDPNGTWSLHIRDDDFGTTGTLTGGWSLLITSANGVPDAAPDSFSAQAGKALEEDGGVLGNDNDPDIDPLTAVLAGKPSKGKLDLRPDGTFTYRPGKKAKGTDSFTYLAQDPGGLSDLETVTIQIKKAKKKGRK